MVCASRALMRNPSAETIALQENLKHGLKKFFEKVRTETMANDSLGSEEERKKKADDIILKILSTANESKGGFDTIQALNDFLSGKVEQSPSGQFTLLENLLTTINYTAYGWTTEDTPFEQKEAKRFCQELVKNGPEYIGNAYPSRKEAMQHGRADRNNLTADLLAKISEHPGAVSAPYGPNRLGTLASVIGTGLRNRAPKQAGQQLFQPDAFVTAMLEAKTPIYGHISGTIPVNLTIASNLLASVNKNFTDDDAKRLAALSAASFYRPQFHAPIEVKFGLDYYLSVRNGTPKPTLPTSPEEIRHLNIEAMRMMAAAANTQLLHAFEPLIETLGIRGDLLQDGSLRSAYDFPGEQKTLAETISRVAQLIDQANDNSSRLDATSLATLSLATTYVGTMTRDSDLNQKVIESSQRAFSDAMDAAIKKVGGDAKKDALQKIYDNFKTTHSFHEIIDFICCAGKARDARIFKAADGNTASLKKFLDALTKNGAEALHEFLRIDRPTPQKIYHAAEEKKSDESQLLTRARAAAEVELRQQDPEHPVPGNSSGPGLR